MVLLIRASVLSIGLNGKDEALCKLPIRLVSIRSGTEAVCSLKNQDFDSVVSNWHLEDMPNGKFLRNLRAVKPYMPTIAFIKVHDRAAEIAARSLGVSAVLTEDASDELFRETVCQILGLKNSVATTIK